VPGVEKDPVVTLSGRITKQHGKDWFFGTDKRPAKTLLLSRVSNAAFLRNT